LEFEMEAETTVMITVPFVLKCRVPPNPLSAFSNGNHWPMRGFSAASDWKENTTTQQAARKQSRFMGAFHANLGS